MTDCPNCASDSARDVTSERRDGAHRRYKCGGCGASILIHPEKGVQEVVQDD